MKRFIIFDCGGILANDMEYSMIRGLVAGESDEIKDKCEKLLSESWKKIRVDSTLTPQWFYKQVLDGLDIIQNESDKQQLINDLCESTLSDFKPYQSTIDLAKQLAINQSLSSSVVLSILSNHGNDWFQYIYNSFGLETPFKDKGNDHLK
eukprot:gene10821-13258_t